MAVLGVLENRRWGTETKGPRGNNSKLEIPDGPRTSGKLSSSTISRWGTSAGLLRRSMVWPAAPMTHATTLQPSSPPRGSSMQPLSLTSPVGTQPSTAAWGVGRHFALPSITPNGSTVRWPRPGAGLSCLPKPFQTQLLCQ